MGHWFCDWTSTTDRNLCRVYRRLGQSGCTWLCQRRPCDGSECGSSGERYHGGEQLAGERRNTSRDGLPRYWTSSGLGLSSSRRTVARRLLSTSDYEMPPGFRWCLMMRTFIKTPGTTAQLVDRVWRTNATTFVQCHLQCFCDSAVFILAYINK